MKEVRLEYYRFKIKRKKKIRLPEKWRELSEEQFMAVTRFYDHKITEAEFLCRFLKLSYLTILKMNSFQVYKLTEVIAFLKDIHKGVPFFFIKRIPGTPFVAPEEYLSNMSFQQFMTADTFFSHYLIYEDAKYLNQLIAALYLRKNERFVITGKKQVLVDLDDNCRMIAKSDHKIRYAIFFNFILIKEWLSAAYPYLFPKSGDADQEVIEINRQHKPVDWLEIFDRFVGDQVPQMDKFQAMNATDAFRILNRKIKDAKHAARK